MCGTHPLRTLRDKFTWWGPYDPCGLKNLATMSICNWVWNLEPKLEMTTIRAWFDPPNEEKKKEESMIQHDQVAYMIFQLFNLIVIH